MVEVERIDLAKRKMVSEKVAYCEDNSFGLWLKTFIIFVTNSYPRERQGKDLGLSLSVVE